MSWAATGRRRIPAAPAGTRTLSVSEVIARGYRPNHGRAAGHPPMGENTTLLPLVEREILRRPALRSYHTRNSIGSRKGWPDLAIWGPGEPHMILQELKGSNGRISVEQADLVESLRAANLAAGFWWPEDYHLGVIRAALDQLAGIDRTRRASVWQPGRKLCGCHMDADHTCKTWG